MKKIVTVLCLLLTLGFLYVKKDIIVNYITRDILLNGTTELVNNEYQKQDDYLLVKNVVDLRPASKDDFNNIMYTILNSGMDEIVIYCQEEYTNCIDDFNDYTNNSEDIEVINNYVSPFNSFKNISVSTDNYNKIKISINKSYSEEEINSVNYFINRFISENVTNSMDDKEKIKLFHDYIINNTKYDSKYQINSDRDLYPYSPYSAYGVLFEGYGICGGYSDTMSIYLDKLGIKNYRIASDEHIWNYVYLNNKWYHLDLTWDDPVTNTGEDVLIYDFFLINTKQLEKKKTSQHNYNKDLYLEAQ